MMCYCVKPIRQRVRAIVSSRPTDSWWMSWRHRIGHLKVNPWSLYWNTGMRRYSKGGRFNNEFGVTGISWGGFLRSVWNELFDDCDTSIAVYWLDHETPPKPEQSLKSHQTLSKGVFPGSMGINLGTNNFQTIGIRPPIDMVLAILYPNSDRADHWVLSSLWWMTPRKHKKPKIMENGEIDATHRSNNRYQHRLGSGVRCLLSRRYTSFIN